MTQALGHVLKLQPRSVLDVGCGYGKWGYLIRECLDFRPGRLDPSEWEVRIDGVDAFPVQSPLLDWVYDDFRVENALEAPLPKGYDLVLLGDIVEHFEKSDGARFLAGLVARNSCVLVNTPRVWFAQEAIAGNRFERHLSYWTPSDFLQFETDIDLAGDTLTAVLRGTGNYPSPRRVRMTRFLQRVPYVRDHATVRTFAKQLLRATS